ncbi:MAG: hypothetical protein QM784_24735 [Polyangiaceae bacterium]
MSHHQFGFLGSPRWSFAAVACILGTFTACSFQRFDDVTERTPVLVLDAPGDGSGTGNSVAALRATNGHALVFATNDQGYLVYDLGTNEPPSTDAKESGSCAVGDGCFLASSVAAVGYRDGEQGRGCFAFAITQRKPGESSVLIRCDDDQNRSIALPSAARTAIGILSDKTTVTPRYASAPRSSPTRLLLGIPEKRTVVFFPSTDADGVSLEVPDVGNSFGKSLAMLDGALSSGTSDGLTGATLLVGEPAENRIHVLVTDAEGQSTTSFCVSGATGFGSRLAVGHFTSKATQGVAIAASDGLAVLPSWLELPRDLPTDGSCLDIEQLAPQRIDCKGLAVQGTCAIGDGSLAPADLDGDGIDELLLGVPLASADGARASGQVLTISVGTDRLKVLERLAPSSIESGDRLGQSVVGVPLSRPDVVLAGAPGGNKLAAFYCSAVLPEGRGGKRCE